MLGAVSGFLSAGFALVSVTVPAGRRAYALGLLLGVVPTATLVGPLLGGMLADAIGYRPVFFLSAALMLVTNWHASRRAALRPGGWVGCSSIVEEKNRHFAE